MAEALTVKVDDCHDMAEVGECSRRPPVSMKPRTSIETLLHWTLLMPVRNSPVCWRCLHSYCRSPDWQQCLECTALPTGSPFRRRSGRSTRLAALDEAFCFGNLLLNSATFRSPLSALFRVEYRRMVEASHLASQVTVSRIDRCMNVWLLLIRLLFSFSLVRWY